MSEENESSQYRNDEGKFLPGHPGFKQKGTENKLTADRKTKLMQVIQAIENKYFEKDLEAMKPTERMQLWLQCHEYVTPKLARVQTEIEIPADLDHFLSMPAEERRQRIIELRELKATQNGRDN